MNYLLFVQNVNLPIGIFQEKMNSNRLGIACKKGRRVDKVKNPFKRPDNSTAIPFHIDESIINDFEKSIEVSKELLKKTAYLIEQSEKMKKLRYNPTPEQSE